MLRRRVDVDELKVEDNDDDEIVRMAARRTNKREEGRKTAAGMSLGMWCILRD